LTDGLVHPLAGLCPQCRARKTAGHHRPDRNRHAGRRTLSRIPGIDQEPPVLHAHLGDPETRRHRAEGEAPEGWPAISGRSGSNPIPRSGCWTPAMRSIPSLGSCVLNYTGLRLGEALAAMECERVESAREFAYIVDTTSPVGSTCRPGRGARQPPARPEPLRPAVPIS
jgi:hypothetical protein